MHNYYWSSPSIFSIYKERSSRFQTLDKPKNKKVYSLPKFLVKKKQDFSDFIFYEFFIQIQFVQIKYKILE